MKNIHYILAHFFTHKDFLVPASQIPGTLFTPLHFWFEAIVLVYIVSFALFLSRHRKLIRPVLTLDWILLVIWEALIIWWDSTACLEPGLDLKAGLSLYPCSIFLTALPLILWGKGIWKRSAYGYVFTLGLLGAAVNFLYPFTRLADYSCISFPAFHTFFFHGSMLFAFLVLLLSGAHGYGRVRTWQQVLLYPCLLSLIFSVPANLLNYTIGSDYMYFRGEFFLLKLLFRDLPAPVITFILYLLYIMIPSLFYLPSFLRQRYLDSRADMERVSVLPQISLWQLMKV